MENGGLLPVITNMEPNPKDLLKFVQPEEDEMPEDANIFERLFYIYFLEYLDSTYDLNLA